MMTMVEASKLYNIQVTSRCVTLVIYAVFSTVEFQHHNHVFRLLFR